MTRGSSTKPVRCNRWAPEGIVTRWYSPIATMAFKGRYEKIPLLDYSLIDRSPHALAE